MATETIWYYTDIPEDVVKIIERDLSENFDDEMDESLTLGKHKSPNRNSKNAWVPTHLWVGGFLWHYIERANRQNFLYDLKCIDGESMQYTQYGPGDYYKWHTDGDLGLYYQPQSIGKSHSDEQKRDDFLMKNTELVRKLSFVMQLSDPDDYVGGNLQFLNPIGEMFVAPRKRGTVILFDSRLAHRVCKVKSGLRKSIVGWVVGPRWR